MKDQNKSSRQEHRPTERPGSDARQGQPSAGSHSGSRQPGTNRTSNDSREHNDPRARIPFEPLDRDEIY